MAIQEEGSETRISDFDEHDRGFDTREHAYRAVDRLVAEDRYPEYRSIWVEELQDSSYWYERYAREDYDDYDDYEDEF
jgi:hypothetical protein